MHALRLVLLGALAFGFLLFAVANWTPVDLILPNGTARTVPLPLLLLGAFIIGLVPAQLWHAAAEARSKRREARTQAMLESALASRSVAPVVVEPVPAAVPPTAP